MNRQVRNQKSITEITNLVPKIKNRVKNQKLAIICNEPANQNPRTESISEFNRVGGEEEEETMRRTSCSN